VTSIARPIESSQDLMDELSATGLDDLALQLEQLAGLEEPIHLVQEGRGLRCEVGGGVFVIDFPITLDDVLTQFSNAEEDLYDTVSPRGYEDSDLFDRW